MLASSADSRSPQSASSGASPGSAGSRNVVSSHATTSATTSARSHQPRTDADGRLKLQSVSMSEASKSSAKKRKVWTQAERAEHSAIEKRRRSEVNDMLLVRSTNLQG